MSKICGVSTSTVLDYIINHPCSPALIGFIVNFSKSKRYVKNDKLKFFFQSFLKGEKKLTYKLWTLIMFKAWRDHNAV